MAFPVTKVLVLNHGESYAICPRCHCTLEREYMNYCDRCGQHLSWSLFSFAEIVHVSPHSP